MGIQAEQSTDYFDLTIATIGIHTPYALLTEIVSHNDIFLKPEFTQVPRDNVMRFTCTIQFIFRENGNSFTVAGRESAAKKAAQHSAAITALNHIGLGPKWVSAAEKADTERHKWKVGEESMMFTRLVGTDYVAPETPDEVLPAEAVSDAESWVLKLRAFAVDHGYELPEFEVLSQIGESHKPVFTMSCTVQETDSGKVISIEMEAYTNKKKLRQMISQKMLMKLHEIKNLEWDGPPMPPGEIVPQTVDGLVTQLASLDLAQSS